MQPTSSHVPAYTPIPPGLYLQQQIDYGRLAAALLQQIAPAQVQPSVIPSVSPVQFPSFPTAQQTTQRQLTMAPFAALPSVMRDVPPYVPSRPTLPPFTSPLGPRSITPTSSVSPPEAAISRDEIVRLIKERLSGRTPTQSSGRSTSAVSRSLTVVDYHSISALVHTREAFERMIQDIVQTAQTANTPAQQVHVPIERIRTFAIASTTNATRPLEQSAASSTSRAALTRPPLQPTIPALRAPPNIEKSQPKPTTRVPPLAPLPGQFAGPSSALFSTASTPMTVSITLTSLTQLSAQQTKQPVQTDLIPSPGWGPYGTEGGDTDDMSGDIDQNIKDVLNALTIPQAELLQASLSMLSTSQPSTLTEQPRTRPPSATTTEAQKPTPIVAAPLSSSGAETPASALIVTSSLAAPPSRTPILPASVANTSTETPMPASSVPSSLIAFTSQLTPTETTKSKHPQSPLKSPSERSPVPSKERSKPSTKTARSQPSNKALIIQQQREEEPQSIQLSSSTGFFSATVSDFDSPTDDYEPLLPKRPAMASRKLDKMERTHAIRKGERMQEQMDAELLAQHEKKKEHKKKVANTQAKAGGASSIKEHFGRIVASSDEPSTKPKSISPTSNLKSSKSASTRHTKRKQQRREPKAEKPERHRQTESDRHQLLAEFLQMIGKEYQLVQQKVDEESRPPSPIKKRPSALQLAAIDLDTIHKKKMEKRMAEYAKKDMIDYEKMKAKFEELFKPHPNIVCRDSYATTAEYAAVFEDFYGRDNQLFTLECLRDMVQLRLHVSYPDRPEMWSSKATRAPSMEEEHAVNFQYTIASDLNLQFDDEQIAERLTKLRSDGNVNKINFVDIFY